MSAEETLIEDFSTHTVSHKRILAFNLMYKGIEVEGKFIECHNDLWDEWHQDVIIENTEELTDADIECITEYVMEKI